MPKTPKAGSTNNLTNIPFSIEHHQTTSQYYHQNNYIHQVPNQYPVHHVQYIPQAQSNYGGPTPAGYANRPESSMNRV